MKNNNKSLVGTSDADKMPLLSTKGVLGFTSCHDTKTGITTWNVLSDEGFEKLKEENKRLFLEQNNTHETP